MAKRKVNRSQAIRNLLSDDPKATPSVIIEALAKKGITVSPALVSAVKYNKAKPANGRRKRRSRRIGASANGQRFDFDKLVAAKALSDRMGGIEKAKEALDMLAKLT
jgi:hypothetical protein